MKIEGELNSVSSIGIVGTGVIGTQIAKLLQLKGYKVPCFDVNKSSPGIISEALEATGSLEELIALSEIVIGCSGRPSIPAQILKKANLRLISASSGDIEFSELLLKKQEKRQGILDRIDFQGEFSGVHVLNGGFPYNFNKENELENLEDIIITRCLMVLGIQQALQGLHTLSGICPLDASAQGKLLENWLYWKGKSESPSIT